MIKDNPPDFNAFRNLIFRNSKKLVILLLLMMLVQSSQGAKKCPFSQGRATGAYDKFEISPKSDKTVGSPIIVKLTRQEGSTGEPLSNKLVIINRLVDGKEVSSITRRSSEAGIVSFTPNIAGEYEVQALGQAARFDVGSSKTTTTTPTTTKKEEITCGDGVCEGDESKSNCPQDCVECGDGLCEGDEDKDSCPDDCAICGDGVCDAHEVLSLHGTSCPEDCLVCGDGFCDEGEDCPEDCGSFSIVMAIIYGAIAGIMIIIIYFARTSKLNFKIKMPELRKTSEGQPIKISKGWVRDDTAMSHEHSEMVKLIKELLEEGVPENHIVDKLVEFGMNKFDSTMLIEKVRSGH